MPKTETELLARDAERDIGAELLQSIREMKAGETGAVHGPVTTVRYRVKMSQSEFAKLPGVSVRTLQEWEQGRREPSGAAPSMIRVVGGTAARVPAMTSLRPCRPHQNHCRPTMTARWSAGTSKRSAKLSTRSSKGRTVTTQPSYWRRTCAGVLTRPIGRSVAASFASTRIQRHVAESGHQVRFIHCYTAEPPLKEMASYPQSCVDVPAVSTMRFADGAGPLPGRSARIK